MATLSSTGLSFPDRTLPRALELRAATDGERPLVRTGDRERTVAETRDAAAGVAGRLAEAGVQAGDRVALLCGNSLELLDVWLACGWLGAISVPVNVALKGGQLDHVLSNADPKVLVLDGALVDRLEHVEASVPSLEHVWTVGDAPPAAFRGIEATAFPGAGKPVPAVAVAPGDALSILYTSGTTGPSKGVTCPHAQLYWYGLNTARHLDVGADDVLYTVLPMFHINALNTFWQALLTGAVYHFGTRFSASRFWGEIGASGATVTYLLGAMIQILLKREPEPAEREHRLRIALCPALSPESVEVVKERFGFLCVEGYGSTETNLTHSNLLGGFVPGAMGRPLPGIEAKVVDEHDVEVPPGTPGELVFRHSEPFSFATGYWRMPEKTVEAWRNLWFHTGDRVVVDDDGVFRFLDRIKDAIRRRGENISSFEVETALLSHPAVEAAAVVPVASELGEDEVMAFVVVRPGREADPVALVRYLEPRLAYFAIPRYLEFVETLPLTENGKIKKYELRERGVGAATWDREAAGVEIRR